MKAKMYHTYVLLFFFYTGFAQDPAFLNTNQSLVYLNPSFAGSNGLVRNQFSYYRQVPGLGAANRYTTVLNTFDAYLKPLKGGLAFSVNYDNVFNGQVKTLAFDLAYAQHIHINNNLKIIPSVQVGFARRKLNQAGLTYSSIIDPRLGAYWDEVEVGPADKKHFADFGSGLLVTYKNKAYAGVSVLHINEPYAGFIGFRRLRSRITAHASYNLQTEKTLYNFFARYTTQNTHTFVQAGVNAVFFKHLVTGISYMSDYYYANAALLSLGVRLNFMALTASYDNGITTTGHAGKPSYGLNASINIRDKQNRKALTSFEAW